MKNFELSIRQEALKDLLVKSFRTLQAMRKRLYAYRSTQNANQAEADKREKELQTLQTTIEECVNYITLVEEEFRRSSVELDELSKNAKLFHEGWLKNIEENIFLANLLINKTNKNERNI